MSIPTAPLEQEIDLARDDLGCCRCPCRVHRIDWSHPEGLPALSGSIESIGGIPRGYPHSHPEGLPAQPDRLSSVSGISVGHFLSPILSHTVCVLNPCYPSPYSRHSRNLLSRDGVTACHTATLTLSLCTLTLIRLRRLRAACTASARHAQGVPGCRCIASRKPALVCPAQPQPGTRVTQFPGPCVPPSAPESRSLTRLKPFQAPLAASCGRRRHASRYGGR